MADYLIDRPRMAVSLHPRLSPHDSSPKAARLALLNYVAERAVVFEPMSPDALLPRVRATASTLGARHGSCTPTSLPAAVPGGRRDQRLRG
jgi:hypothetical protein